MVLRHLERVRFPQIGYPYGSSQLARNLRIGAGSQFVSDDIACEYGGDKSFRISADGRGSWRIQVSHAGTDQYFTPLGFEGTVPAGRGSGKTISFEEPVRRARILFNNLPSGSPRIIDVSVAAFRPGPKW